MVLKCGITGFHSVDRFHELPRVDFKDFKQMLGSVMSSMGYKPIEFKHSDSTHNFHIGVFEKNREQLFIICNPVYPVVALTLDPEKVFGLDFISVPTVENAINQYTEYVVLTKEYLETPFSKYDTGELNDAEISQIKYWKPKTLGEVIFNWWD